jgi:hypothetical protein
MLRGTCLQPHVTGKVGSIVAALHDVADKDSIDELRVYFALGESSLGGEGGELGGGEALELATEGACLCVCV